MLNEQQQKRKGKLLKEAKQGMVSEVQLVESCLSLLSSFTCVQQELWFLCPAYYYYCCCCCDQKRQKMKGGGETYKIYRVGFGSHF